MLARQRAEQFSNVVGFRVRQAGCGFVEQQQMWLLHQQHTNLEKLFLPVRKQPRRALAVRSQPQQLQHFINPIPLLAAEFRP